MSYKLFLDDDADGVRRPDITVENDAWRAKMNLSAQRPDGHAVGEGWAIARSVAEAIAIIEQRGFPQFVSFDHDLGEGEAAIKLAHHLIELDLDHGLMPDSFSWEVHSANRVGRANIDLLLEGYLNHKRR